MLEKIKNHWLHFTRRKKKNASCIMKYKTFLSICLILFRMSCINCNGYLHCCIVCRLVGKHFTLLKNNRY